VFVSGGVLGSYSAGVEVFNVLEGGEKEIYVDRAVSRGITFVRTYGQVNTVTI
jgi:hypothetical protein